MSLDLEVHMSDPRAPILALTSFLVALGLPAAALAAPAGAPGVPDGVPLDRPAADTIMVELSSKNDSGIRARARLVHGEDQLRVAIAAVGLDAGEEYPAHIHQGTCEEGGGVAAGLDPVQKESEEDDAGTSISAVSAEELKEAKDEVESEHPSFFLQIHLPDGTPAACGDIEKEGSH